MYTKKEPLIAKKEIKKLPLLLTTRQAAQLGNWSDRTVRVMCEAGQIKAVRVGRTWRIHRDALIELLDIS